MFFPFSPRDRKREWITDLNKEALGIVDWNSLVLAFYQKYFPPEKMNLLRSQIQSFKQGYDETLSEAWEHSRSILDSAANGRFTNNTDDDKAWALIEEMVVHTSQFGKSRGNSRQAHDDRDKTSLNAIASQLSALSMKSQSVLNPSPQPNLQSNAPPPQQNNYVPPHRNFQPTSNYSYQRPQQYHQQYAHPPPPPVQPSSETVEIKAMLQQSLANQGKQEAQISQLMAYKKILDTQLAQMASSNPKATQPPSMSSHENVSAVILRSGTQYEGPRMPDEFENTNENDAEESATKPLDTSQLDFEKSKSSEKWAVDTNGKSLDRAAPGTRPIDQETRLSEHEARPGGTEARLSACSGEVFVNPSAVQPENDPSK
ncbi:hypothetical protein RND81_01G110400 [Saponaria officinalis]|uniref:Retrotransposon gag domain-containing protein n=1 Tax=Saponaria officinalis TaxID=3572 RepID=A0AAW1NEQ7_SAPOF